ncbi:hypothetical protein RJ640_027935 [Escallonia rubra]|uniref:Protein kinase domain-containing protein n=1 Tax=Escallonia rubra TaxID=112253 RepID=A0AA88UKZ8_9ASTE|nr:hypothetical protein RJ640_027935 [Escallonia rubra]
MLSEPPEIEHDALHGNQPPSPVNGKDQQQLQDSLVIGEDDVGRSIKKAKNIHEQGLGGAARRPKRGSGEDQSPKASPHTNRPAPFDGPVLEALAENEASDSTKDKDKAQDVMVIVDLTDFTTEKSPPSIPTRPLEGNVWNVENDPAEPEPGMEIDREIPVKMLYNSPNLIEAIPSTVVHGKDEYENFVTQLKRIKPDFLCRKSKRPTIEIDLQPVAEHRRISHQEIQEATKGFEESNLLGNGSFGSVYKGILSDGMVLAIKTGLNKRTFNPSPNCQDPQKAKLENDSPSDAHTLRIWSVEEKAMGPQSGEDEDHWNCSISAPVV